MPCPIKENNSTRRLNILRDIRLMFSKINIAFGSVDILNMSEYKYINEELCVNNHLNNMIMFLSDKNLYSTHTFEYKFEIYIFELYEKLIEIQPLRMEVHLVNKCKTILSIFLLEEFTSMEYDDCYTIDELVKRFCYNIPYKTINEIKKLNTYDTVLICIKTIFTRIIPELNHIF